MARNKSTLANSQCGLLKFILYTVDPIQVYYLYFILFVKICNLQFFGTPAVNTSVIYVLIETYGNIEIHRASALLE